MISADVLLRTVIVLAVIAAVLVAAFAIDRVVRVLWLDPQQRTCGQCQSKTEQEVEGK